MATSTVYGAIVNLILNVVLVYFIGAQGAAIATLISNIMIYTMRHRAINHYFVDNIYKTILLSWVLLIIQSVLMILNYSIFVQVLLFIANILIYKKFIIILMYKFLYVLNRLR